VPRGRTNFGDGGPASTPEPGFEDRRGALGQPLDGERAAVHQHDDDRPVGIEQSIGQRLLGPGQAEIGAAPRFAAEIEILADDEDHQIGAARRFDGTRDARTVIAARRGAGLEDQLGA
jgi:hypothetical protein